MTNKEARKLRKGNRIQFHLGGTDRTREGDVLRTYKTRRFDTMVVVQEKHLRDLGQVEAGEAVVRCHTSVPARFILRKVTS